MPLSAPNVSIPACKCWNSSEIGFRGRRMESHIYLISIWLIITCLLSICYDLVFLANFIIIFPSFVLFNREFLFCTVLRCLPRFKKMFRHPPALFLPPLFVATPLFLLTPSTCFCNLRLTLQVVITTLEETYVSVSASYYVPHSISTQFLSS